MPGLLGHNETRDVLQRGQGFALAADELAEIGSLDVEHNGSYVAIGLAAAGLDFGRHVHAVEQIREHLAGARQFLVVFIGALSGYAISQLNFPGRRILWWLILASFMVPIPALIVNHYVLMANFKLINTWLGVILPQLIAPVTVIIYKQFFDSVPREFREAAKIDGANELQLFFRLYLPMNWGITTALAIIAFIGAWNNFLWPFLAVTKEQAMNVTVGITQVTDAFGVKYARDLGAAMLAGLPVAIMYLIFQRRVTQAIMLTAGIKG